MTRMNIRVADLQPGDAFTRQMQRWVVVEVGERLPGDTRRPIQVRQARTGEERTFRIRDTGSIWVNRPNDEEQDT